MIYTILITAPIPMMKKEQLTGTMILLLILGGCTVLQSGPKFAWSAYVLNKAQGVNWICIGTMRVGELVNPVTWFWTPPISHYFVQSNDAKLVNNSTTDWLVQTVVKSFDEKQMTYLERFDTATNKTAYIGTSATFEDNLKTKMRNPDWKEPETEWDKNTLQWLKDGKPQNSNYCN
jgi:hypothetical protein